MKTGFTLMVGVLLCGLAHAQCVYNGSAGFYVMALNGASLDTLRYGSQTDFDTNGYTLKFFNGDTLRCNATDELQVYETGWSYNGWNGTDYTFPGAEKLSGNLSTDVIEGCAYNSYLATYRIPNNATELDVLINGVRHTMPIERLSDNTAAPHLLVTIKQNGVAQTVEFKTGECRPDEIMLYDVSGHRLAYSRNNASNELELTTNNALAPGIYIVEARGNRSDISRKVWLQ